MTGVVGRLHGQGLLAREPDPDDRRSVRVSITDDGRAMLARRRRDRADKLAELIAGLPAADVDALAAAVPAITHLVERSALTPSGASA
jgi:DNA-binding MarR family transcriptional regulator